MAKKGKSQERETGSPIKTAQNNSKRNNHIKAKIDNKQ